MDNVAFAGSIVVLAGEKGKREMRFKHACVIALLLGLVTGCGQRSVMLHPAAPCDEIVNPALLTIPFDELSQSREKTEQWILTEYPTATVQYQGTGSLEDAGHFYWTDGPKGISLVLRQQTRLVTLTRPQFPTLDHILRCFGEPTYYSLGYSSGGIEVTAGVLIELWYPDIGLYFAGGIYGASTKRQYDRNMVFSEIIVMPPGTVEVMTQNANLQSERYRDSEQARLKEWPENFTELVLEE